MLKNSIRNQENVITKKEELCDIFRSGFKNCDGKNIGLEFEKLPIDSEHYTAAKYVDVVLFLQDFYKLQMKESEKISEHGYLLGLKNNDGTITLEPGSQTELSLNPRQSIHEIKKYLDSYNKVSAQIAQKHNITWLGYGIQPVSTYRNMTIIPKKRYEFMTKYLPTVAKRPLVMMRETSGIQVSCDYSSEEDAMKKLSLALKLSPIVSAMFANSPVRNGHLTKYKSNRAASWLDTDDNRCGLISPKAFIDNEFTFQEYAEILLDVPMIFIERDDINGQKVAIPVNAISFREFLENGYNGYFATKEDWLLHLSLYFPDVRFKNYIEIRNHDNQRRDLICAVPALWKGLIYNHSAIESVQDVLKGFSYFDFQYLRKTTPKKGLDIKIKQHKLVDIAREIVQISSDSLKAFGQGEEIFLEPLDALLQKAKTPADVIVEKWENEWQGKVAKLVEYSVLD